MTRKVWFVVSCLIFLLPIYSHALTALYHLHKERSDIREVLQLKTSGPDARINAFQSPQLKNQPPGEYLIKAFDTQAGVPNFSGTIPKGSTMVFSLWMKKAADFGAMHPLAKLYLNNATGTPLCSAAGSSPLTTILFNHTFRCTTVTDIAVTPQDRFYLWVGANMTIGPGANRVKAELDIEGTLNGNYDSLIIVSRPTITSLSPTSGTVGTAVTITGLDFGDTQGASTVTFNGTQTAITSWSDTTIVTTVPSGVNLVTKLAEVVVTVAGVKSDGAPFSMDVPDLPAGYIATVAGNGSSFYSGEGGPAPNAGIGVPTGVSVDNSGALFIAVFSQDRILKVNQYGIISAFAGNGTSGYSGDGGSATSAQLRLPEAVAADNNGNVFIADTGNSRIRKVSQDGLIATIAGTGVAGYSGDGGPATEAQLSYPNGVAIDGQGNLLISGGFRIRKVDTNGIITTVAGNGTAGYSGDGGSAINAQIYPRGVAVDGFGNLFINDQPNHRVRKVDTSGIITTIAGTGVAGYSGDGGIATGARLNYPSGVAVDAKGNVFISDKNNNSVRKVSSIGIISTIAGNGIYGYSGDNGPATNAQLRYPFGVAVDTQGNFFIADYFNYRVRKVMAKVSPAVNSLLPISGAVGTSVTISGSNFGTTQGSSTITFNGALSAPTSWSDTSIVTTVPSGATTGPVVVTVEGEASNGVTFTVSPQVNSLSPNTGPVGTSVTISGSNFGVTQGTSTVTFNGTLATPTNWSDTVIVVPVPTDATTGPVIVTVGGIVSNGITFTVSPKIASLSPASGPVGTSVTISGYNFGATHGNSTVTFNGALATPTSWSDTTITAPVPSGVSTGPVVVTVDGISSNGVTFTIPPIISSLSPSSGPINTLVTITGSNFGTSQGTSTVAFNGVLATPKNWSSTSITVPVPSGATTGLVIVTISGVDSNGETFIVLTDTLTITYPVNGSVINRPDTAITGRLPAVTGEVGVTVNGQITMVNGQDFAVNGVGLTIGENTITATMTDENGNTSTTSIIVYNEVQDAYVKLSSNIESGLSPLSTQLTLDTTLPATITETTLSIDGPTSTPDTPTTFPYTVTLQNTGIYLLTVTVRTGDGNSYEDIFALSVLDAVAMDTLLKGKWISMIDALNRGDTTTALTQIFSGSQASYQTMFSVLSDQLSSIIATERGFNLIDITDNVAKYKLLTLENGKTYSYEVLFIKDTDGLWRIKEF